MNASRAANATSISDAELRRRAAAAEAAAPGVVALPVRIVGGRRWAALPGVARRDLPAEPPELWRLADDAGVALYGICGLDAERRSAVERALAGSDTTRGVSQLSNVET